MYLYWVRPWASYPFDKPWSPFHLGQKGGSRSLRDPSSNFPTMEVNKDKQTLPKKRRKDKQVESIKCQLVGLHLRRGFC